MTTGEAQLSLLARDTGMALALTRHGIDEWKSQARAAITAMPAGWRFTADDLIDLVGLPTGEPGQNANNAVGATINGLARSGLITKTEQRVRSLRKESHAREMAVWRRSR